MGKITLRDLARRENQNFYRLLQWVRRGWLPAKKETVLVAKRDRGGGKIKQKYLSWVVHEEDWYEVPTWIREKYKRRGGKKSEK